MKLYLEAVDTVTKEPVEFFASLREIKTKDFHTKTIDRITAELTTQLAAIGKQVTSTKVVTEDYLSRAEQRQYEDNGEITTPTSFMPLPNIFEI